MRTANGLQSAASYSQPQRLDVTAEQLGDLVEFEEASFHELTRSLSVAAASRLGTRIVHIVNK
jgi:hypothetical protein